ncbi:MAG: alanine--tRNA ligase [Candidatus Levybacteria bacterium]|nr:alanine--tRNA ligase [Candidatus Levybacteria bacterium]
MLTASEIIQKYLTFFENHGHTKIANSPLVLQNDPTTLFTSSGMQPLVPYLLGETHPDGKRLVNVQNCFRAQDIDEIGDNRHTTFFRMLGNWSLGDYFKKDQLTWIFEFLTKELNLDPQKLYVTVYAGEGDQKVKKGEILQPLALDRESIDIWTDLFKSVNINATFLDLKDLNFNVNQQEINQARIFSYGSNKNWWSRSGTPKQMPIEEPGGPDSEIFFDFGTELQIHENSSFKDEKCHPNCDCGRFMEIGNSVFMQYKKIDENTFQELPNRNVDFGGGLERLLCALKNDPDVFRTEIFRSIVDSIRESSGLIIDPSSPIFSPEKYYPLGNNGNTIYNQENESFIKELGKQSTRIIADHIRAATFLLADNVIPSNKAQGYVLRRLIRRAILRGRDLGINTNFTSHIAESVIKINKDTDPQLEANRDKILELFNSEELKFRNTLEKGLKEFEKYIIFSEVNKPETKVKMLSPQDIFRLYESYGFPYELSKEEGEKRNIKIPSKEEFDLEFQKHRNLSKTSSGGMFKGGLADTEEKTVMGHTATHLLHQALRDVLGNHVHQTGSNITTERLRFDFNYEEKLSDEQIKQVETTVNEKIKENLPVHFEMIKTEEAKKMGAIGLFSDTYGDTSKIYFIGPSTGQGSPNGDSGLKPYSIEFCGGPHVDFTGKLKRFTIIKQESLGNNQRRVYAIVGDQT